MSKVFDLLYYPLAIAAEELKCSEIKLLILAQAGVITLYHFPDPTGGLLNWESISTVDIGAVLIRGTTTGRRYSDALADTDIQLTDIVLPLEEMVKVRSLLEISENERKEDKKESTKTINYLARFAKSLIQIHYGEDIANDIKKQLNRSDSEICIDFKNKKIKKPLGKTIAKYFDAVDVDTIDN